MNKRDIGLDGDDIRCDFGDGTRVTGICTSGLQESVKGGGRDSRSSTWQGCIMTPVNDVERVIGLIWNEALWAAVVH